MKTRSLFRTALIGAVVFSLTAIPAAAQSIADSPAPAKATVEASKQAPALVSVEASRVGIARAQVNATADALAEQEMGQTMKWIIIIAVGILAAFLIMSIVD